MREVRPLNHGDIDCSGHYSGGLKTSVMGLNLRTLSNYPSVTICIMCELFTFPIIPMLQTSWYNAWTGFVELRVGTKSALWLTAPTSHELRCIVLYCRQHGLYWERLTSQGGSYGNRAAVNYMLE